MKLSDAVRMSLEESRMFCEDTTILEDGEGPRWLSNKYKLYEPKILLLL